MDRACSTHGRDKNAYNVLLENLKGGDCSEDLGLDGEIISEWILGKLVGMC